MKRDGSELQKQYSDVQDKYRTLVEDLSVGIYRDTPGSKGHFLEVNSAMVSMFEAESKKELMKHSVSDLYQNPLDRKKFVAEIIKKGEVKNREANLITLRGRKFVSSITAVMKKGENGEIHFDGVLEDITNRKKMEQQLINDKNFLESKVRKRTCELRELSEKQAKEIVIRRKVQNVLMMNNEELEKTKKAMLNIMEDLDEAKSAIDKQRSRDESILASVGDGLIAIDSEGKIIVMNKVAEKLLGWNTKEALGKLYNDIISLENENGISIPLGERPLSKALASFTTTTTTTELFLVSKNKVKFPVAIIVSPIVLDNKIIGAVEVFRDITREKEIDKAKTEFVSLASHQLRTPLGITKWYLEALDSEDYFKKAPAVIRNYFNEIHKSNERLLSLVRGLLSVSRIEQGRVKDVPKMIDVKKLVMEVVEQMKAVSRKKNIDLVLTVQAEKIPLINIDTLRLREVIENLVTNALEYTKAGGNVSVALQKIGGEISISFKDTGMGISEGDRKNLFTKFFRSEEAIKNNPEGSGLGLYVVKSYVEGWGGSISVESVYGKGSTFTIILPIKVKRIKGVQQ